MSAFSVKCWPGLKAKLSRSSGGTSNRIDLASLVSGINSAMRSGWKLTLIFVSMAFEQVERLEAGKAAPERLARRRAEPAHLLRIGRSALRTFGGSAARGHWRRHAVVAELPPPFLADPVGRSGLRKPGIDGDKI